jgi:hypothetical protein
MTITFNDLNALNDIAFIGGSTYTIKFVVLDQNGSPIDISTATCNWKLAPFGSDYVVLSKTGSIITTNSFEIILSPADTYSLSGKYSHQPSMTFPSGVSIIPAQGTITIVKGLQTS